MKAIGVDIGTTSICGVLIDCQKETVERSITKNSEAFIVTANPWEKIQDTNKIIKIAEGIIEELISEEVVVIGLTGQMHGIVYYDEQGKAVSPLYTWQDERGSEISSQGCSYTELLGLPNGYGFVTDSYNRERGLCPERAVGFCTIADYLGMYLTQRRNPVIHASNAASFGKYDIKGNYFVEDFPAKVCSMFEVIGEYQGIPVSVAIGDNQASVLGSIRSDEDILLNIGTGSQISVVSTEIIQTKHTEVRPYVEGKYLIVGAALCGGRAYSMLEKFFSEIVYAATGEKISMYESMSKMERTQNHHLQADTRFGGSRQDASVTGSITGITTENFTPGELRYAILYGIVEELYQMFQEMKIHRAGLVGAGNGLRKNKALVMAAQEIFGMEMKIPAHTEEAAFGAAISGMYATNLGVAAGRINESNAFRRSL